MTTWGGTVIPLRSSDRVINTLGNIKLLVTRASQWKKLQMLLCVLLNAGTANLQI